MLFNTRLFSQNFTYQRFGLLHHTIGLPLVTICLILVENQRFVQPYPLVAFGDDYLIKALFFSFAFVGNHFLTIVQMPYNS